MGTFAVQTKLETDRLKGVLSESKLPLLLERNIVLELTRTKPIAEVIDEQRTKNSQTTRTQDLVRGGQSGEHRGRLWMRLNSFDRHDSRLRARNRNPQRVKVRGAIEAASMNKLRAVRLSGVVLRFLRVPSKGYLGLCEGHRCALDRAVDYS